jgi:hypothetical protein
VLCGLKTLKKIFSAAFCIYFVSLQVKNIETIMRSPRKLSNASRQSKYYKAKTNSKQNIRSTLSSADNIWSIPSNVNIGELWSFNNSGEQIANFESYKSSTTNSESSATTQSPATTIPTATNNTASKKPGNLRDDLRIWALIRRIPLVALTELLHTLVKYGSDLPLDSRTLLGTPTSILQLINVSPGQYYHHGIEEPIKTRLELIDSAGGDSIPSELKCYINIDGLPLCKSNSNCFWPIQILIPSLKNFLFVCGIYYGPKKPENFNIFLKPFTTEMQSIDETGVVVRGRTFQLKINGFVCDAPCKPEASAIDPFNGKYGCGKCTTVGTFIHNTCFPELNAEERTDDSFRNRQQIKHHKPERSILELLPINMVDDFLLDPMHVLYLGVQKKLISFWMDGPSGRRKKNEIIVHPMVDENSEAVQAFYYTKLNEEKKRQLTERVKLISYNLPRDFAHLPRDMKHYGRWKATEFRLFLHYTGPVLLMNILDDDLYQNFLKLHVASTILASDWVFEKNPLADHLMKTFITTTTELYGPSFITYNVHSLSHLAKEAQKHGKLQNFSAFCFESNLGNLKGLIRKPKQPLQQVVRRMVELEYLNTVLEEEDKYPELCSLSYGGPEIADCEIYFEKCMLSKKYTLSTNQKDDLVITHDKNYFIIKNFSYKNNKVIAIGCYLSEPTPIYTNPINSMDLGIGSLSSELFENEDNITSISADEIKRKCVYYQLNNKTYIFPLLH